MKQTDSRPPKFARVRAHNRADYDRVTINPILDKALLAHVGYVFEDRPIVVPMIFARHGDRLYLHGASKARIIAHNHQRPLCVTVTHLDGLVVARSSFHHSANYRSVVVHGTGELVDDQEEKAFALQLITEHLLPGRYAEIRGVTAQEYKATGVLAMTIEQASAKIRTGPPKDDDDDCDGTSWAGVLPVQTIIGEAIADSFSPVGGAGPESLELSRRRFSQG